MKEEEVSLLVGKAIMVYEEKGEKIKKEEEERWVSLFQYEADKDCKPGKI